MSNSITTGIFGAFMGLLTAIAGVLWSLQYYAIDSMHQSAVTLQNLVFIFGELELFIGSIQNIMLGNAMSSFAFLTIIFVLFALLTLILMGIGLYGIGKIEGKAMGTVSLVIGIIGAVLALILILAGAVAGGTTHTWTSIWMISELPGLLGSAPLWVIFLVLNIVPGVPTVGVAYLWLGLVVLGITLIIFGITFIMMRETLASPGLSVATGVLAIIAGIFLFAGPIAPWLAFIVFFVASIMAALIFFQAREMA
ncbi:MAG: hypothetical protein ACETWM_12725 [Candidatus Lokiarchaeia archaeon]